MYNSCFSQISGSYLRSPLNVCLKAPNSNICPLANNLPATGVNPSASHTYTCTFIHVGVLVLSQEELSFLGQPH